MRVGTHQNLAEQGSYLVGVGTHKSLVKYRLIPGEGKYSPELYKRRLKPDRGWYLSKYLSSGGSAKEQHPKDNRAKGLTPSPTN